MTGDYWYNNVYGDRFGNGFGNSNMYVGGNCTNGMAVQKWGWWGAM